MNGITYRELRIELEEAGAREIPALDLDSYAAAFTAASDPTAAAAAVTPVWIRLGGGSRDPINLIRKPLCRGECGTFGAVMLEWGASPGVVLELTLGKRLDVGVRV